MCNDVCKKWLTYHLTSMKVQTLYLLCWECIGSCPIRTKEVLVIRIMWYCSMLSRPHRHALDCNWLMCVHGVWVNKLFTSPFPHERLIKNTLNVIVYARNKRIINRPMGCSNWLTTLSEITNPSECRYTVDYFSLCFAPSQLLTLETQSTINT